MKLSSTNRQILALAIPSIIANITTPLLALVDTAIAGHMGSAVFIAAIAVGGTVFNMLYWAFGFLRMGSSGPTAQEWGRGDREATHNVLYRSLVISLIGGVLLIALQEPVLRIMLRFMDTDAETSALVGTYFHILIYGAPAVLANYSLTGWYLGMQNSRIPMWTSFIINIVNIAVSLTLVFILKWEIKGVATGTLAAQWCGCLLGLFLTRRYGFSFRNFRYEKVFDYTEFKRFFSINLDIFLRTLCLIAVTVWFTRIGALQSTVMLAVNTLLMQFFIIFSYFMDGFAFAGEALAGRYAGARDIINFRATVKSLIKWGLMLALTFTCIYVVGGDFMLHLLSDDGNVLSASAEFKWWATAIPVAGFAAFTWDGIFVGATMTRSMLLSMSASMAVFFISLHFAFPSMKNDGLWLSFLLYLLTRGIILTIIYLRKRDYRF